MVQSLDSDGLSSISDSSEVLDVKLADENKEEWPSQFAMKIVDMNFNSPKSMTEDEDDDIDILYPIVEILCVPEQSAEVTVRTEAAVVKHESAMAYIHMPVQKLVKPTTVIPPMPAKTIVQPTDTLGMPTPPLSPDCCDFVSSSYDPDSDVTMDSECDEKPRTKDFSLLQIEDWEPSVESAVDPNEAIMHDCWWNGLCDEIGCRRNAAASSEDPAVDARRSPHRRVSELSLNLTRVHRSFSPEHIPLSPLFGATLLPEPQEAYRIGSSYPLSDHSYHASRIPTPEPEPVPEPTTVIPVVFNQWHQVLGLETPSDSAASPESEPADAPNATSAVCSANDVEYKEKLQQAVMQVARKRTYKRGRKKQTSELKITFKRVSAGRQNIYRATKQPAAKRGRGVGRPSKKLTNYLSKNNLPSSSSSSASSSGSEDGDKEKRREHNDMERRRRNDLKSLFDNLRKQVPAIQNSDRAAKVLILGKSRDFIHHEVDRERRLVDIKEILTKRNEYLMKVLESHRRALGKAV